MGWDGARRACYRTCGGGGFKCIGCMGWNGARCACYRTCGGGVFKCVDCKDGAWRACYRTCGGVSSVLAAWDGMVHGVRVIGHVGVGQLAYYVDSTYSDGGRIATSPQRLQLYGFFRISTETALSTEMGNPT